MSKKNEKIGYACAYTPLVLIHAVGYTPYRILPMSECPDQAGQLLHDNLCPHVKRILDRAISKDLPDLAGVVFIKSCDAMRRLCDAWQHVRPDDNIILLDLPATTDDAAVAFFANELTRLSESLSEWSGRRIKNSDIETSIQQYNNLCDLFAQLHEQHRQGKLPGGSTAMQTLYNAAMMAPFEKSLTRLQQALAEPVTKASESDGIPVFLFGNVLADPEAFALFESCGARIIEDDLCTGSRLFTPIEISGNKNLVLQISRSLLTRPPCARTFDPAQPLKMAEDILTRAQASGARGIIGQTIKFCHPYLDRLPVVRETVREAGIPLLLLEGDCSLRSIEQQRTRIEAFIEMLV
ncbi:MAG: 2-hydroxyacyl-CoA dehydratase [Deltaproteobacteria bacterium]|jgi:benzoyl-CoA reductase/2-hydroxyglutaryl-CoA dehydratase subunit BcrC/BadD/HgdB|nr:2-hydroxyacyl-CoA dehydratase [Deltaproteobacteria bacterium]